MLSAASEPWNEKSTWIIRTPHDDHKGNDGQDSRHHQKYLRRNKCTDLIAPVATQTESGGAGL